MTERPHMRWHSIVNAIAILAIAGGLVVLGVLCDNALGAPHHAGGRHTQAVPAITAPTGHHVMPAGGGRTPCATVARCRHDLAWARRDRARLRQRLLHRTRVDLHHAIAISAALFGVSARDMTCIAWAESGYGAQTSPEPSSGALGPFQWLSSSWATTPLGRAGYARTDLLAASLSTAQRVVIDHGWHEWVTGPGCGL